jgi:AcrR family transcriptional regulator
MGVKKSAGAEMVASTTASKRSQTRQRLLDAALRLIDSNGSEALTVLDVSRAADLANGGFYYHFKDKQDLVDQLGYAIVSDMMQRLTAELQRVPNAAERVAFGAVKLIHQLDTYSAVSWLVLQALENPGLPREPLEAGLRSDVAYGVVRGDFPIKPTEQLFHCIYAICACAARARLEGGDAAELAHDTADHCLRLLGLPPKESGSIARKVQRWLRSADGDGKSRSSRRPAKGTHEKS